MSKVEAKPNGGLWTAVQCAICRQKHFVDDSNPDLNKWPDFLILKNLIQIRKNQLESTENADTGIGPNHLLLAMLHTFVWQHCQWYCLQKIFS